MAQILYYAATGALCAAATVQIASRVFFRDAPAPTDHKTCRDGLLALHRSIDDGRQKAANLPDASGERTLAIYREGVEVGWAQRDAVEKLCQDDAHGLTTLDALVRLRYAEELGARGRAAELSALRQRVRDSLLRTSTKVP